MAGSCGVLASVGNGVFVVSGVMGVGDAGKVTRRFVVVTMAVGEISGVGEDCVAVVVAEMGVLVGVEMLINVGVAGCVRVAGKRIVVAGIVVAVVPKVSVGVAEESI